VITKIFYPKDEFNKQLRILHNEELPDLYRSPNFVTEKTLQGYDGLDGETDLLRILVEKTLGRSK
jgi:hypothetical protein